MNGILDAAEAMVLDFHLKFGHKICDSLAHEQSLCAPGNNVAKLTLQRMTQILLDFAKGTKQVGEELSKLGDDRVYRMYLLIEEVGELAEELCNGDEVGAVGEMVDIMYVIIGTGITLTLPLGEAFEEKHKSNMTKQAKLKGPGYKGPGYVEADMKSALQRGRAGSKWVPSAVRETDAVVSKTPKQKCDTCGFKFRGKSNERCPVCQGPTVSSKRRREDDGQ